MASRIAFIFTIILCSYLLNQKCVEGNILSKKEDLELQKQLKLLNKPAVKTIKTEYGDIFDCVDFYKQPAFDHPLLKNHMFHFQMKPSSIPKEIRSESYSKSSGATSVKLKGIGCPFGTVPIRRTTKGDLIRDKLFSEIFASNKHPLSKQNPGLHFAGVSPSFKVEKKFDGAQARLSIHHTPHVEAFEYSTGLIKLSNGDDYIKAGWMVSPTVYEDNRTRLFTYLHAGNSRCFNTRCPGFVLVNPDIPLDLPFVNISIPGVEAHDTKFFIFRDTVNGNWWLNLGEEDTDVGFWPKHIFTGLGNPASEVFWGGEVFGLPKILSPPMGSGIILQVDPIFDAYCRRIAYVNGNRVKDADQLDEYADRASVYKVVQKSYPDAGYWGRTILYGGRGGITGD